MTNDKETKTIEALNHSRHSKLHSGHNKPVRLRNVPLATLSGLLEITKSGNQGVTNIRDRRLQLVRPAMPLCQRRDICR
jgi:hypothetical protein